MNIALYKTLKEGKPENRGYSNKVKMAALAALSTLAVAQNVQAAEISPESLQVARALAGDANTSFNTQGIIVLDTDKLPQNFRSLENRNQVVADVLSMTDPTAIDRLSQRNLSGLVHSIVTADPNDPGAHVSIDRNGRVTCVAVIPENNFTETTKHTTPDEMRQYIAATGVMSCAIAHLNENQPAFINQANSRVAGALHVFGGDSGKIRHLGDVEAMSVANDWKEGRPVELGRLFTARALHMAADRIDRTPELKDMVTDARSVLGFARTMTTRVVSETRQTPQNLATALNENRVRNGVSLESLNLPQSLQDSLKTALSREDTNRTGQYNLIQASDILPRFDSVAHGLVGNGVINNNITTRSSVDSETLVRPNRSAQNRENIQSLARSTGNGTNGQTLQANGSLRAVNSDEVKTIQNQVAEIEKNIRITSIPSGRTTSAYQMSIRLVPPVIMVQKTPLERQDAGFVVNGTAVSDTRQNQTNSLINGVYTSNENNDRPLIHRVQVQFHNNGHDSRAEQFARLSPQQRQFEQMNWSQQVQMRIQQCQVSSQGNQAMIGAAQALAGIAGVFGGGGINNYSWQGGAVAQNFNNLNAQRCIQGVQEQDMEMRRIFQRGEMIAQSMNNQQQWQRGPGFNQGFNQFGNGGGVSFEESNRRANGQQPRQNGVNFDDSNRRARGQQFHDPNGFQGSPKGFSR